MADPILQIADDLEPSFRRAFLDAVRAAGTANTAEIVEALNTGNIRVLEHSGFWIAFTDKLEPALRVAVQNAVIRAGQHAVNQMPQAVATQLRFDLSNPRVLTAAETVVADAVQSITNASQEGLREALKRGFEEGITAQQLARRIRSEVGLTDRDITALENLRANMVDNGISQTKADAAAERYAGRLLRARASLIAQTETMRAANEGQRLAWVDAKAEGLLDPEHRRYWLVTPDDRLCPRCESVPDDNPEGRAIDEPFDTDVGPLMGPPLHPRCRCVTVLQIRKLARVA